MINIPLSKIREKILENTDLTEAQLDDKVKQKLDQLSGLISEEGASHIIANELGVKLVQTSGKLEIKNILSGMRDVEVVGKVARKYEVRSFNSGERSGKVGNFMIVDETGMIRTVLWNEQADNMEKFGEGDVVLIKSAYARDNNGKPEIHLNQNSELKVNPTGVKVDVDVSKATEPTRKKIVDLVETDSNVEVLATIVQVFEPKFFENKRKQKETDPDFGCVMNVFIDDGSDNMRAVLWREQAKNFLEMNDEQIMKFKDNPADFEPLKNELLGNIVKIRGRIQKNDMFDRLELVAYTTTKNPDPEEEIKNLQSETEATEKVEETTESEEAMVAEEKVAVVEKPVEEVVEEKEAPVEAEEEIEETPAKETTEEQTTEVKETTQEEKPKETTETSKDVELDFDDDDIISLEDL